MIKQFAVRPVFGRNTFVPKKWSIFTEKLITEKKRISTEKKITEKWYIFTEKATSRKNSISH